MGMPNPVTAEWLREQRAQAENIPDPAKAMVLMLLNVIEDQAIRMRMVLEDQAIRMRLAPVGGRGGDGGNAYVGGGGGGGGGVGSIRTVMVGAGGAGFGGGGGGGGAVHLVDQAARDGLSALKDRMALLEADCEWLRERRQRAELLPSPARDVVISLLDLVENLTLRLALALADAALTKPAPMAREVDHVRAGLSVEIDALKMRVTEVEKRTVDHAARDGLSALKGRIDEVRVDIGCLNDRAGALEEQVDKRFNDLAARVEDVEAKIDWRK